MQVRKDCKRFIISVYRLYLVSENSENSEEVL